LGWLFVVRWGRRLAAWPKNYPSAYDQPTTNNQQPTWSREPGAAFKPGANDVETLLDQASHKDLIVRTQDGREFMLVEIGDFDLEIARTRQNPKLMALLDQRAREPGGIPLEEAKRQLGIAD
jgi:hypothetical protein